MFERYTEKARRVIFFARYEASQYGSPYIESEHLLLGLLRENSHIVDLLPSGSLESIRQQIDTASPKRPGVTTSVDLPLTNECKRILAYAAEEAERLAHKHIGTEHLLLALLRESRCLAAKILGERGLRLNTLRQQIATISVRIADTWTRQQPVPFIHGVARNIKVLHDRVRPIRRSNWHWAKTSFKARDVIVHRQSGKLFLDLSLTADSENFELMQRGWSKDPCLICDWELYESADDPERGIGYTNGRDWVCSECYEKFLQGPDYFATAHPEIT